jgi:hypothetical protein
LILTSFHAVGVTAENTEIFEGDLTIEPQGSRNTMMKSTMRPKVLKVACILDRQRVQSEWEVSSMEKSSCAFIKGTIFSFCNTIPFRCVGWTSDELTFIVGEKRWQ